MKKILLASSALFLAASPAFAAGKSYQVTGPVLELTDSKIVVEKGKEKWELARDKNTKIPATVQVGSKVTAQYSMTATDVEDKGAAKAEKKAATPAKDAAKEEKSAAAKPAADAKSAPAAAAKPAEAKPAAAAAPQPAAAH